MRQLRALVCLITLFLSCNKSEEVPAGIIKPEKMQQIFWDMIRGDLLAQEIIKKDSSKNIKDESQAIADKIFLLHNINRKQFNESVAFYEKRPDLIKAILDSLNSKQTRTGFLENERKMKRQRDYHNLRTK